MDLIQQMIDAGFCLDCGPHDGLISGYYAVFYKIAETCPECNGLMMDGWNTSGHGLTLTTAIEMAAEIASEVDVVVPTPEAF